MSSLLLPYLAPTQAGTPSPKIPHMAGPAVSDLQHFLPLIRPVSCAQASLTWLRFHLCTPAVRQAHGAQRSSVPPGGAQKGPRSSQQPDLPGVSGEMGLVSLAPAG